MEDHKKLGQQGEGFAATWLKKNKGYKIITRNFHAQGGELDIVAYDKKEDFYILVEVKTRTNEHFALGIESVGRSKIKKMQRAAASFFFRKMHFHEMPDYEIHAMILIPKNDLSFWEKQQNKPVFEVDYYDDLG